MERKGEVDVASYKCDNGGMPTPGKRIKGSNDGIEANESENG